MKLRLPEVARLLQESEETVSRWVREGVLPAHQIQEQYWFDRVDLQEWADARQHRVSPELFENGAASPRLHPALARGGVCYGVPGARREDVLAAVAALPGIPATVDRSLLLQLLLSREHLASTGLGDGIAVPHPRDPLVLGVTAPVVVLCFLEHPVDFHAVDGKPIRVLFTLLSPTVRSHLQVLSRLAFALHDRPLRALLDQLAPAEAILERVRVLEAEGGTAAPREAR